MDNGRTGDYETSDLVRLQDVWLQESSAARRKCRLILGGIVFKRRATVPRTMRAEQHPLPYDHRLQEFLTSLKRERGSPMLRLSTANVR